jgi:hypothetical protein
MRTDWVSLIDRIHEVVADVVLITSGRGLEDSGVVAELGARSEWLEVYLQFDSLRARALRALRGPVITPALRRSRLEALTSVEARVAAVCIVSDGQNEDEVASLVEYVRSVGAVGVTFQPLRQVGRMPLEEPGRGSTVDSVQGAALSAAGVSDPRPIPFAPQPFDLTAAWVESGTVHTSDRLFGPDQPSGFRITTSSYWDANNYFEPLARFEQAYWWISREMDTVPLNSSYFIGSSCESPVVVRLDTAVGSI